MNIIFYIALLIAGGVLNIAKEPKATFIINLARCFIVIAALMSISSWLFYCSAVKNAFMQFQMRWVGGLANIVLGYLLGNILMRLASDDEDSELLKKTIRLVCWAVTILTGFSFIMESWWMIQNADKMRSFFALSGYAEWFMYFVMIAEVLGGLGILLHFWLKTGKIAACGLMLIMIGALYTHCHNRDPFTDSNAAIIEFVTLGMLQLVYYFEHTLRQGPPAFNIVPDLHADQS